MKPLKKPTKAKGCVHRARFDRVCEEIRKALHLEHWESRYDQEFKDDPERVLYATNKCYLEGRRLWISIYPAFFELTPEDQLRTLIHEHVHTIHNPHNQIIEKVIGWSHEADRRWSEMIDTKLHEHVTDHLTSVLYDLIKDRFEKL